MSVARDVSAVVLVVQHVFVVGEEVVAATTRVLAGGGRDLDQISERLIRRWVQLRCAASKKEWKSR
jgi:hypothetical protein